MDTLYPSIENALGVAAENMAARRELARRGPNHVIVADVVAVPGGFHLQSVAVEAWATWSPAPTRHVVRESSGVGAFVCPVCEREGSVTGGWRSADATGSIVSGLNEANCAGCHDTLTTRGIAPRRFTTGESGESGESGEAGEAGEPLPRPE